MEATEGLHAVISKRTVLEQGLGDAKYHRIIHVRNAAVSALREVTSLILQHLLCEPLHVLADAFSIGS